MIAFEKMFAETQADKMGLEKFCIRGDGKEYPENVLVLYWGKVNPLGYAGFCYNTADNVERLKKAGYKF